VATPVERARGLPGQANSLEELYAAGEALQLTPGWISRKVPILKPWMSTHYEPGHWSYQDVRAALDAAGRLIDVELAERRNLLLRNFTPDAEWATTRTLVCAYQMILPGEFAPSHRHTGNALRLIIEGEGAYSIVDDVRMPMNTGDVVLTPGQCWHGHGHGGQTPAYWLDCLDVPLSYLLETMRFTPPQSKVETAAPLVERSPYRFARDDIARALDTAPSDPEGRRGPWAVLPTPSMQPIGLIAQRILSGSATRRRRSSANRIFAVVSGDGSTTVADCTFAWGRGDTIVVPGGYWFAHEARSDTQLLEMTDEPLMIFSNHYDEELG
jgi:gentisate 1,2-dioxygenase